MLTVHAVAFARHYPAEIDAMNRLGHVSLMLLVLGTAQTMAASSDDEQTLMQIENRLSEAFRAGDADTVARIEDEGYTLTNSRALVSHRADDIAEVKKRDPRYDEFRTHDMKVRLYGDTAIVIGIVSLKGTSGGKPFDADMRFTDTFVRRDGEWRIVAAQVTKIEK
jgi:ketosteroid isomerase-like protein